MPPQGGGRGRRGCGPIPGGRMGHAVELLRPLVFALYALLYVIRCIPSTFRAVQLLLYPPGLHPGSVFWATVVWNEIFSKSPVEGASRMRMFLWACGPGFFLERGFFALPGGVVGC